MTVTPLYCRTLGLEDPPVRGSLADWVAQPSRAMATTPASPENGCHGDSGRFGGGLAESEAAESPVTVNGHRKCQGLSAALRTERSDRSGAAGWEPRWRRDGGDRAERLAGLEPKPGRGWHSLRRKFASDLMDQPLKVLCQLGGWKTAKTVLRCYQRADEGQLRKALEDRRRARS